MIEKNEEMLKILLKIEKYLKEEKYEELKKYIISKKIEINLIEENYTSDYIDKLVKELN